MSAVVTIEPSTLAIVSSIVCALISGILTLFGIILKDRDRVIKRNDDLEQKLDAVQKEAWAQLDAVQKDALARALKSVEDQRITAERYAVISEFMTKHAQKLSQGDS